MTIKQEIISAIAGASLIGGGTTVLISAKDNAVQDSQIERQERRMDSIDSTLKQLNDSVQQLDKSVAVLSERMGEQKE